jgi:hypothetical protein
MIANSTPTNLTKNFFLFVVQEIAVFGSYDYLKNHHKGDLVASINVCISITLESKCMQYDLNYSYLSLEDSIFYKIRRKP